MESDGWRKIWCNLSPEQFGDVFHENMFILSPGDSISRKFMLRNLSELCTMLVLKHVHFNNIAIKN